MNITRKLCATPPQQLIILRLMVRVCYHVDNGRQHKGLLFNSVFRLLKNAQEKWPFFV